MHKRYNKWGLPHEGTRGRAISPEFGFLNNVTNKQENHKRVEANLKKLNLADISDGEEENEWESKFESMSADEHCEVIVGEKFIKNR